MYTPQLPPGHVGLPVIGESFSFLFDPQFIQKRYNQYGSIFKTSILGRPTAFMIGPEAAEFVLSSHINHFSWKDGWPNNFKQLLGESLFVQDGEEHRQKRRLMMPAFHGQALARYISTIDAITQTYFHKWEQKQEFRWFEEFKQLTFEIASQLLVGASPGQQVQELSQLFTTLTNGLFAINPLPLPFTQYRRALAARNQLLQYIAEVVKTRQQQPTNDVLSLLVQAKDEAGNSMSLQELTAQAMLLLFAGHETTTSMLTWFCLELGCHPEVLQRAREEQLRLADGEVMSLEQLGKMQYLDQIFCEIERLHPPVGGGFRGVVKPFEFNGFHVPAGWLVLYSIQTTHQLASLYPEPKKFDPDRFSPERQEHKQKPFSLIGFGGGPRICLGIAFAKLEMKLIAAKLLRHYQWELPQQSLEAVTIPTRRPKDGLRVRFYKIEEN